MKKTMLILFGLLASVEASFSQSISKETLCQKWHLEKYEILWSDYAPEENEKNDYIALSKDMTYKSVSEGEYTVGKWSFDNKEKSFTLFDENGDGLKFYIEKLKVDHLVAIMDVKEMNKVHIHFITKE